MRLAAFSYGVAVNPTLPVAYVGGYVTNSVEVIDTTTNTISDAIPIDGGPPDGISRPWDVAFTPDGKFAFVTTQVGRVAVIDVLEGGVVVQIPVGCGPWGIAIATIPGR